MLPKTTSLYLFVFLTAVCRADLLRYADQIPKCGLACILQSIPASACQSVLNSTCICNDPGLAAASTNCVLKRCSVEEALKVMEVQDEACQRPRRSRRTALFGFVAVEAFTLVCILGRMYSRWKTALQYQVDDYLLFVVLLLFLVFTALGQFARFIAFGRDIWTLDSDTITTALKFFYIDESFYIVTLSLCKIVMLCFFLRIFPDRWFQRTVQVFMVFVGLTAFALVILQIFQCIPFEYNWEGWKGTMESKCLDVNSLTYAVASVAIAQDFLIILLPLPLLVKLQLGWRKKAGIILMFSLGTLVFLTACIRLRYLVNFAKSINPTWDYTDTILWTALELNVSIIVISLPPIRVLLSRVWPGVLSSKQNTLPLSATFGRSTMKSPATTSRSSKGQNKLSGMYSKRCVTGVNGNESQLELGDRGDRMTQTVAGVEYGHGHARRMSVGSGNTSTYVTRGTITQTTGPRGEETALYS